MVLPQIRDPFVYTVFVILFLVSAVVILLPSFLSAYISIFVFWFGVDLSDLWPASHYVETIIPAVRNARTGQAGLPADSASTIVAVIPSLLTTLCYRRTASGSAVLNWLGRFFFIISVTAIACSLIALGYIVPSRRSVQAAITESQTDLQTMRDICHFSMTCSMFYFLFAIGLGGEEKS